MHLIGKAPVKDQDDIETSWGQVYELNRSATKVDAFLRRSWITHMGDVKSRTLYREIKSVIDTGKEKAPLNSPIAFSQSLASDAEFYKDIVATNHASDECAYWLRAINTLGASSLLPAALAGLAASPPLSDANYEKLLSRLVTVFVRWNVISAGESTELEEAVFDVAKKVRSGESVIKATAGLRGFLQDDASIVGSFKELVVRRPGYQRYLLEALEDSMSKGAGVVGMPAEKPVAGSKTLWIEHIYPQSPTSHWGKWADHDDYLNRLGNLTLIHKKTNAAAQNKDIVAKKVEYLGPGLKMNAYFRTVTSWSPDMIDDRQAKLAKRVPKIWPRF